MGSREVNNTQRSQPVALKNSHIQIRQLFNESMWRFHAKPISVPIILERLDLFLHIAAEIACMTNNETE